MKLDRWSVSAFLLLYLVAGRSSAATQGSSIGPVSSNPLPAWALRIAWTMQMPVLQALHPEDARRWEEEPVEPGQPLIRDHEAVLPNPLNGRELVDRVLADDMRGQPDALRTSLDPDLQRFYSAQRLAALNTTLPIARRN